MASWNEIERVRRSPEAFKPLAARLLSLPDANWWDYAANFLRDIAVYPQPEINTRQAEFLLKLRDDKAQHFRVGDGLSVALLIPRCYAARFDLDDDTDIEFVEWLHKSSRSYVTGRQRAWFVRICKQLGFVEAYV
jgi:hypothetical protein